MTTAIRSLLAASAAAALLAAPAARAHDQDRVVPAPSWAGPVQGPAAEPCPPAPPLPEPMIAPGGFAPRFQGPFQALRAEYDRLEQARAGFYASWRGNPMAQRRFEAWYAARRVELDRRAGLLATRAGWHRPPGYAYADPRRGEARGHERGRHDRDDD